MDIDNIQTINQSANYIDINSNSIFLFDDVDSRFAREILTQLLIWDQPDFNVNLYINSNGGDLYSALSIISVLKSKKYLNLNVIITGVALSAAAMIALCGDQIKMSKYGMMLLHYPISESIESSIVKQNEDSKIHIAIFENIMKDLLKNTKLNFADFLIKAKDKDCFFTAKQCLKLKLVHEVF